MAKTHFSPPIRRSKLAAPAFLAFGLAASLFGSSAAQDAPPSQIAGSPASLDFQKGDRIVLIGNTLAERMQHFGHFETRLQLSHPGLGLTLRNMGWSADEVDLMPRPLAFGTLEEHLADKKASVILMFFGTNESFKGKAGLMDFSEALGALVDRLEGKNFDGRAPVRLALISPTAHEKLPPPFPDPKQRNEMLEMYTQAMQQLARERGLFFVDLFHPTLNLMAEHPEIRFTINGMHFIDEGYRIVGDLLASRFDSDSTISTSASADALRDLVVEKNKQFFLRWRPINGEYVYGRRKEPFGVISYPPEMAELDRIIADLEQKIHAEATRLTGGEAKQGGVKP